MEEVPEDLANDQERRKKNIFCQKPIRKLSVTTF